MGSTIPTVKSVLFRTRELLRQRHELKINRNLIHYDVERWSRAIMLDRPQSIHSQG
jgi:RNA polymerase sigma-70 factor (ECF subfamily)